MTPPHRLPAALLAAALAALLLAGCSSDPDPRPAAQEVVNTLRLQAEDEAGRPELVDQTVKAYPTYWTSRGTLPGDTDTVVRQTTERLAGAGWELFDDEPSESFDRQLRFVKAGITARLVIGQPSADTALEPVDGAVYVVVEVGQSDSGPDWTETG